MSNTYWDVEIPIIVRTLINDMENSPTYTDDRIKQLVVVSANYVIADVNLNTEYKIDVINEHITPDPSNPQSRDTAFIGLLALKSACLLDQSTFRTKALMEGIRTKLGPAELDISGNLTGFKTLLEVGPCALYENLKQQYNIGNASVIRAVLSPFVGNTFDPQMLNSGSGDYRLIDNIAT